MAKIVTGIKDAHELLDELLKERHYYGRLSQPDMDFGLDAEDKGYKIGRADETEDRVRRVKVVHIDYSWDLSHPMMPTDLLFGSEDSENINAARIADTSNHYKSLHGTACVAALRVKDDTLPLSEEEEKLWNLADFAEVVLVPIRDYPAEETAQDRAEAVRLYAEYVGWPQNLVDYMSEAILKGTDPDIEKIANEVVQTYQTSTQITAALDEVISLSTANILERGDVVVITLHEELGDDAAHLPIIHNPWVEAKVRELTNGHEISVVIPSGNSSLNLDTVEVSRLGVKTLPHMRDKELTLYQNYGVRCGAVLVGSREDRRAATTVNSGQCIDVYGRSKLSVPDTTDLPNGQELYQHWHGSTIASVVAAALLACVQQIRFASPETPLPLKPYEARAHLRQWKSRSSEGYECVDDLTGPPPNISDWLRGTGIL